MPANGTCHYSYLFDLVCIYIRHLLVDSLNDARRSSDAARFNSDDIVPRITPSHPFDIGVGDAKLFLRMRIFTGTLTVRLALTSTDA